jgi:GLPGLI family protein
MKTKIYLSILWLLLSVVVSYAQGVCVEYREERVPGESIKNLDAATAAVVKEQAKQSAKTMCLYHYQHESVYKLITEEQKGPEVTQVAPNHTRRFISLVGTEVLYKNRKTNRRISQESILEKKFLITDTLPSRSWTIEKEEKTILGYVCQKAVDTLGYVAWFSPDIPVDDGPLIYSGLPGLILELHLKGTLITAQKIDLQCDAAKEIKIPTSGRKVSRKEYNVLLQKKTDEISTPREAGEGESVRVRTITF